VSVENRNVDLPESKEDTKSSGVSGYASVLRNPQFMCLWIAQIFSQFADRAVFVLFVAVLTTLQHSTIAGKFVGAAQMTSLLYVAFTIPAIILSPIAGVYVDRFSNKLVLVLSSLFRAATVCLIATPLVKQAPSIALSLAFLISIGSQFFAPAETASIPRLVKKDDLLAANSLFFTTMMIALGFGFAIGDPIIESTGLGKAPYAVAIGFFISALCLLGIKDTKPQKKEHEPWWEELRFGIAYIVSSRYVFRAIVKITILFSTIITLNIIAVALAEQVLDLQPHQFGYIVAGAGLGMGIGNFFVGIFGAKMHAPVLAYRGFCCLGFFMSVLGSLGFIKDHAVELGLHTFTYQGLLILIPLTISVLIGASCAMVAVPTYSALQGAVPEQLRGKVFGAQNTAMSAASTIPVVLAGVAADNLPGGVSTTLFLIGLPTLALGFYYLQEELKLVKSEESGEYLEKKN
jgi:MFS family permease